MLCVSDMMKSSHVQELQGPSCKLRARSMGTPWAAVDIRWYSEGCYLAPRLDCPVKQFWHGSCPCYYFAYGQDLQVWWPPPLTQTPGQLWPGTTSSQQTPWLPLTRPIPRWDQQQAAPPAQQPPPRTPGGKRERGLVFHLRRGDRAAGPKARAGGNTEGRGLVLSMLPEAGKGSEEEEEGRRTKLGEEKQWKRNPMTWQKKQLWEGGRGNRRRGND